MVTKKEIVELLMTNDRAVGRALVALNARQTKDEQVSEHTRHDNGRGFRPCHARMGTSMANFFTKFGRLSEKQVAYWRKPMKDGKPRITIYAGQLLEVAEHKAAAKTAEVRNPYIGQDVGNLMEERMVLDEINPLDPRIAQITEAIAVMTKVSKEEREMQRMEAEGDREETRRDELNKFIARCRMERS